MFMRSTYVPNMGSYKSGTYGIDMLETSLVIGKNRFEGRYTENTKYLPKAGYKK